MTITSRHRARRRLVVDASLGRWAHRRRAVTFLFIIGTGRCGSTLAASLLAEHPDVGYISAAEERLWPLVGPRLSPRLYRRLGRSGAAQRLRDRCRPAEAYSVMERAVSPMLTAPCRDLTAADLDPLTRERLRSFFEMERARHGCAVFVHKFTGWPRARLLHAAMPEARFLHVVRDGRAVANSLVRMPWWDGYRGPAGWSFGKLPAKE